MDDEAILARRLAVVFTHLATPVRLGDWLTEVTAVLADAEQPAGIGAEFGLRLRRGDTETSGTGQLIAYEPPWSVAYRLRAGLDTYVLRVTCTSTTAGTRVCVQQTGHAHPLAVNLARLRQGMAPAPDDLRECAPGRCNAPPR